ncbi:hypothetical protein ABIB96_006710 [Bradyrhizobium sp. LA3.X]
MRTTYQTGRKGSFFRVRRVDTSGKTPAEWHHRHEFGSTRAGAPAAGFLLASGVQRTPVVRRMVSGSSSNENGFLIIGRPPRRGSRPDNCRIFNSGRSCFASSAVHARHTDVRDEDGDVLVLPEPIKRIRAALGACHLAAEIFQHAHDDVEDAGIVVNNPYSMAHRAHGPLTEGINAPLFG